MEVELEEEGGRGAALSKGRRVDSEQKERRLRTKATQSWLQEQLATEANPGLCLERVLKGSILEVSAWDMIANSSTLQDLIFRKMVIPIGRQDVGLEKTPEVKVSSIGVTKDGRLSYMENTPRVDALIGTSRVALQGLVDTGAEVNVITAKLAADARLPVRPEPNISMVSHTGHKRSFSGMCDSVPMNVGGIVVKTHFFVLEDAEHQLVLGQPFIKSARLTFSYDEEGSQFVRIMDDDDEEVEVLASSGKTDAERIKEKIMLKGKARLA
jgi:hypothetical protein